MTVMSAVSATESRRAGGGDLLRIRPGCSSSYPDSSAEIAPIALLLATTEIAPWLRSQ
jgi:hypothetical protein